MTIASIKSILAGVGGTLVLAAFCTTFITLEKVLTIIPLFIAFNGALTGFKVVETLKSRIRDIGLFSLVMGVGGGAATFAVVNLTGRWIGHPFYLTLADLAIYIVVSGVTSYMGAKLAAKHFNI